jgi:epoxyqueuosine reductase
MICVHRDELRKPKLKDLLALDDQAFRTLFSGSPIKRTGRDRFIRNCLIAAGNSGDLTLLPRIEHLLQDASPLVRAMAIWALRQLADAPHVGALKQNYMQDETDTNVTLEWTRPQ